MRNYLYWSLIIFGLGALTWSNIPEPPPAAGPKSAPNTNVQTVPVENHSRNPYTPDRPTEEFHSYDSVIS